MSPLSTTLYLCTTVHFPFSSSLLFNIVYYNNKITFLLHYKCTIFKRTKICPLTHDFYLTLEYQGQCI
jgi:hypothetical protein